MENLVIEGSSDAFFIPTVNFDASTGKLELSGESYQEDTRAFYSPLIKWIDQFVGQVKKPILFEVKLTYYNTSSSKSILEIFYALKDYQDKGGDVTVKWYYGEDDVEVEEEIEDFEMESGLKINLIKTDDLEK